MNTPTATTELATTHDLPTHNLVGNALRTCQCGNVAYLADNSTDCLACRA